MFQFLRYVKILQLKIVLLSNLGELVYFGTLTDTLWGALKEVFETRRLKG